MRVHMAWALCQQGLRALEGDCALGKPIGCSQALSRRKAPWHSGGP